MRTLRREAPNKHRNKRRPSMQPTGFSMISQIHVSKSVTGSRREGGVCGLPGPAMIYIKTPYVVLLSLSKGPISYVALHSAQKDPL